MGIDNIFNILSGKKDDEFKTLVESIRHAFKKVKVELDDHLDSINQNTTDVQELNELILEIDAKVDKISEKIDALELAVNPKKVKETNMKLTPREQEVFMALYVGKHLTLDEIAKRLGFTSDMVNLYLFNLISKGIPIQKEMSDNLLVFSLDSEFKDLQTRRNILNIDHRIAKQLSKKEI